VYLGPRPSYWSWVSQTASLPHCRHRCCRDARAEAISADDCLRRPGDVIVIHSLRNRKCPVPTLLRMRTAGKPGRVALMCAASICHYAARNHQCASEVDTRHEWLTIYELSRQVYCFVKRKSPHSNFVPLTRPLYYRLWNLSSLYALKHTATYQCSCSPVEESDATQQSQLLCFCLRRKSSLIL